MTDFHDSFMRVKDRLGKIIDDPYKERSMWPRLARMERWWNDMKRKPPTEVEVENIESELDRLTDLLRKK